MTKLLDKAIAEVRKLPAPRQDEAADILLFLAAQETSALSLSPDQQAEIKRRPVTEPRYLSEAQDSQSAAFRSRQEDNETVSCRDGATTRTIGLTKG